MSQGFLNRYSPGPISSFEDVRTELQKLGGVVNALLDGYVEIRHNAPTKVKDGMVVYADGTDWNPGSGEGVYARIAGAWVKL